MLGCSVDTSNQTQQSMTNPIWRLLYFNFPADPTLSRYYTQLISKRTVTSCSQLSTLLSADDQINQQQEDAISGGRYVTQIEPDDVHSSN